MHEAVRERVRTDAAPRAAGVLEADAGDAMTARSKQGVRVPDAVVFVDFDGVLNDDEWLRRTAHEMSPTHVARLNDLCLKAGAAVVVSSGWRCFTALDDLRALLSRAGLTVPVPVLGAVECDCDPDCGRAKHSERWLDAHPEVRRWVVLDDEYPWLGPKWRGRVVMTDGAVGLTGADAARALAILTEGR